MTSRVWGATGLVARYGAVTALRGVDVRLARGAVTAVVGGDGAGKSTLARCLAGAAAADAGTIEVPPPGRIGYVSDAPGVFADLTCDENLRFAAAAYRVDPATVDDRIPDLLASTALVSARDRLARHLSGGMRQKLALACALIHRPELLVLDEPTTGVDPVSRADVWRLLARAAAGGAAVLLTTAHVDEAERAADVVVLHEGRVLLTGPPATIVGVPGRLVASTHRLERSRSWRRGRTWRTWDPDGRYPDERAVTPDLEDTVVVELLRDAGTDPGVGA